MTYALSDSLSLPEQAWLRKYAILGNSGSGKSYAAGVLVEEFLQPADRSQSVPVVVIDPVGVWWGLRLSKSGKRDSGIDIPILGGMHADVALPGELSPSPFGTDAGAVIGETLAKAAGSAILDVSILDGASQRRLITDFAIAYFDTMARHRHPCHVVIDEAQLFLPEQAGGGDMRMIGAFDKLTRLGRNHGIGHTLISQRPQSVRKASLNLANVLIAFALPGTHERKAIRDWVNDVGATEDGVSAADLLDRLASLETGDGLLWSPSWLKTITPIRTRTKRTFDASSGVDEDADVGTNPKQLKSAALIQALTQAMSAEHTADPDTLKRRIRDRDRTIGELRSRLAELTPGKGHCFSAMCGWSIDWSGDASNEPIVNQNGPSVHKRASRVHKGGKKRTKRKPAKKCGRRGRNVPGEILGVLEQADGKNVHLQDLAKAVKLKHTSSHFRRQLRKLRDDGRIQKIGRFHIALVTRGPS